MPPDYLDDLRLSTAYVDEKSTDLYLTDDYTYLEDLVLLLRDVQYIEKGQLDEFTVRNDRYRQRPIVVSTRTGKRILRALKRLFSLNARNDEYRLLHPTLTLFRQLADQSPCVVADFNYQEADIQVNCLNRFIQQFRSAVSTGQHRRRLRDYQRVAKKNRRGVIKYIDHLFERHARLLVVRVDLSYRREVTVTPDLARQHRERFFKSLQGHRLFTHCVGHVWKLEYGRYKGSHYHLMLFFNGNHVRQDITLAQRIGEYWRNTVTGGTGLYFNCNARKADYRHLGIGMVGHADTSMREGLRLAASYLCKVDTYARLVLPEGARTFGRGEIQTLPANKRGRPRQTS